jgi:transposase InsO family protein
VFGQFRSQAVQLTAQANAVAERFVRTVRTECLDWLLLLNQPHLERAVAAFIKHYNTHRPHRGLHLTPPQPARPPGMLAGSLDGTVLRRDRLGGLVHEYVLAA